MDRDLNRSSSEFGRRHPTASTTARQVFRTRLEYLYSLDSAFYSCKKKHFSFFQTAGKMRENISATQPPHVAVITITGFHSFIKRKHPLNRQYVGQERAKTALI
jgi:hypothetical protein